MTPQRALDWSLAALAFAAPLSVAGMNASLCLLSAAVLWAWRDPEAGPHVRQALAEAAFSPVLALLGASALWFLVSSFAADEPARSLRLVPKELHKLWVFFALMGALGAARRGPALRASALGLGAHALIGIAGVAAAAWAHGGPIRARGFVHPVSYGNILGLAIVFAACALTRPSSAPERRAAGALAALIGLALVLNQTRAVLVAAIAAAAAAALAAPVLRRRIIGALLILGAVGTLWEFMPTGGRNLRTLFSGGEAGAGHRSRLVLWRTAAEMTLGDPWTGVGPGNFRSSFERRHPAPLDAERSWGSAHNLFLHQSAERGAVGLLLLLGLFGTLAASAWRASRQRPAAGLAAFAATAAFFVMNLTETAWQTEQVATFFLLVWTWGAGPRRAGEVL